MSGFITGLYVVATPLFAAVLLHTRITLLTWGAVLLAVVGLGVLTLDGFSIGYGEALTFVAALLYALHIVGLGAWSTPGDAMGLAILQLIVIAVVCLVCTAPDGIVLPDRTSDWRRRPLHGADPRSARRSSARPGPRPTCRRPGRRS